ncbi:MAG: monovalent cation/H(+) antiporter subunit G [Promicromonosporaceae bacterium]|nr:monovalent cation/H(+) antiporter subunit G [Promicromonosporaceae bacterium]
MLTDVLGNALIGVGVLAVVLGLVGVLRFPQFELKLLAGAKIDTVALIAIVVGASLRSGLTWFTAKALLILALVLVVNPIVTSKIAASARLDAARAAAAEPDEGPDA